MRRNVRPKPGEPDTKVSCECGEELVTMRPGRQVVTSGGNPTKHECGGCGKKVTVRWEDG